MKLNNWFNKPMRYYSYYELFENSYLPDGIDHF